MIYLAIYITNNCTTCQKVVVDAEKIAQTYSSVKLQVKHISDHKEKCNIVPAVFLNNQLYCYGEFNSEKLLKQIKSHLNT